MDKVIKRTMMDTAGEGYDKLSFIVTEAHLSAMDWIEQNIALGFTEEQSLEVVRDRLSTTFQDREK